MERTKREEMREGEKLGERKRRGRRKGREMGGGREGERKVGGTEEKKPSLSKPQKCLRRGSLLTHSVLSPAGLSIKQWSQWRGRQGLNTGQ